MFKLCHYIKDDNRVCDAPAMRRQRYCYHHLEFLRRERSAAKARQRMLRTILKKNPPTSLAAVHKAMDGIRNAMDLGHLEIEQSRLMLSVLRLMANNIRDCPELRTPAALQAMLARWRSPRQRVSPCG